MALRTVFQIWPKIQLVRIFCRSRIVAGFRKTTGFRPEPESGTALVCRHDLFKGNSN